MEHRMPSGNIEMLGLTAEGAEIQLPPVARSAANRDLPRPAPGLLWTRYRRSLTLQNVAICRLSLLSPFADISIMSAFADIGNRGDKCVFVHRSTWALLSASAEKPCVSTRRPWPRKSA